DRLARHPHHGGGDAWRRAAVIRVHGQHGDGENRARKRDADDKDAPVHGEPTVPSLQESPTTAAVVIRRYRRHSGDAPAPYRVCCASAKGNRRALVELRNRPPGGEFLYTGQALPLSARLRATKSLNRSVMVALQSRRPHATEGTDRRWPKTTRGSASASRARARSGWGGSPTTRARTS